MQAIQAAQQFAGSLGIGAPRASAAPPAGTPPPVAAEPPPAAIDPGAASAAPPFAGQPPAAAPEPAAAIAQPQPAPPSPYTAPQPPYAAPPAAPPSGFGDQLGWLLQALGQRQIPPLPGSAAPPAATPTPMAAPAPPQPDAFGLLRTILTNPQLQHALQAAPAFGAAARSVMLPVPSPAAPQQTRQVPVHLGAVMNAIAALAGQSMHELNENVSEEEPEIPPYLVDDDGNFIVDPASPDDRAALVTHLFRLSEEAQRSGRYPQRRSRFGEADAELDESDRFAFEAGF